MRGRRRTPDEPVPGGSAMSFQHLRVATRLGIGYGLVSVLLIVVTALGLNRMAHIKDRVDEITKVNDIEARLAGVMDLTVTERALALRNLILLDSSNTKEIQMEVDRVAEQDKKYAEAEQKLGEMFARQAGTTAREKELLDQIRQQAKLAAPFYPRAVRLALDGKGTEAYQLVRFEFRPVQKKWWALLRDLAKVEQQQNEEQQHQADEAYANARVLMTAFGLLAVVSGVLAAWVISPKVCR